jgi:hypothetical protein
LDRRSALRDGIASTARHGVLSIASHISKILVKLCAGKPHAQFERGLHGNGPAVTLEPHHNLPMNESVGSPEGYRAGTSSEEPDNTFKRTI